MSSLCLEMLWACLTPLCSQVLFMELCTRSGPTPGIVWLKYVAQSSKEIWLMKCSEWFFFGASGLFYKVKGIDKRSVTIMMPIGCNLLLTSKAWPASATCRATWMLSPQRSAILPMSLMQSVFSWWGNSEFWKCAEKIRANHQSKL